jgi:hypothetical protein
MAPGSLRGLKATHPVGHSLSHAYQRQHASWQWNALRGQAFRLWFRFNPGQRLLVRCSAGVGFLYVGMRLHGCHFLLSPAAHACSNRVMSSCLEGLMCSLVHAILHGHACKQPCRCCRLSAGKCWTHNRLCALRITQWTCCFVGLRCRVRHVVWFNLLLFQP